VARKNHFITLPDIYLAYRKAKAEAFYENTHFHALAFSDFELDLDSNLRKLYERLNDNQAPWVLDAEWLGGYSYAPKSVEPAKSTEDERVFYRFLDPLNDWKRQWDAAGKSRLKANLRLVITPSVNFQIISAIWLLKVGHKYDSALDSNLSFGNRLRRRKQIGVDGHTVLRPLNLDCTALFAPYFSAYSKWRKDGLEAIRSALEEQDRVVAVTMDLKQFYHRVSPKFLTRKKFLSALGIKLSKSERTLTEQLVSAIETWYAATPDVDDRPEGAIPVGLSASKVIANVLLCEFDRRIRETVQPDYYGRYVDDIFMVVRLADSPLSGDDVMKRLAGQLPDILRYKANVKGEDGGGLRVVFDYARDSELVFTGSKLKVFNLEGHYGLDLIRQISEQIRKHSSEHRMLPLLPDSTEGMASRALLAQPSATLEADALRKADAISVRRLGLSLLLRDVEAYARDLRPHAWRIRREQFYGLVQRHVVTPVGFFDFFSYIHRVFGLMISCGDFDDAIKLVDRLGEVIKVLEETTTAGGSDKEKFNACCQFYSRALMQVALQSSTVVGFSKWPIERLRKVLYALCVIDDSIVFPKTGKKLKHLSMQLLHTDWGRRPYRDYWLHSGQRQLKNPVVPKVQLVKRILAGVRGFRKAADIPIPYWPGVVYPTRPLSFAEITVAAPSLVRSAAKLRSTLFAFRGARMKREDGIVELLSGNDHSPPELHVNAKELSKVNVVVPSILTTMDEWNAALEGKQQLGVERYERIMGLTNEMMRVSPRPDYLTFPECSLPSTWASTIARKLADRGISMLAGLEYRMSRLGVRNDALISLCTQWPWYASAISFRQPKGAPSHEEKSALWKSGKKRLYQPRPDEIMLPVYVHGGFCFGVLICSDLTNIVHRTRFQGNVDAVFVLEWNQDVESFGSLVESAAQDLHSYVVQVNNRQYGDSRIRSPRRVAYERDAVRIKGGTRDYFVTSTVDISALRTSQRQKQTLADLDFKPTPIGFNMSERRKSNG